MAVLRWFLALFYLTPRPLLRFVGPDLAHQGALGNDQRNRAYPSSPAGVVDVTQSAESRCITGEIGDWYGPS